MIKKEFIVWMLIMVLLVTFITGCSKKTKNETSETDVEVTEQTKSDGAMGRYVEEDIPLPEDLANGIKERLYQMVKNQDGKVELSCRQVGAPVGKNDVTYVLNEDSTWGRQLPNWLNQKNRNKWLVTFLAYSPKGSRYALTDLGDPDSEVIQPNGREILKSSDGETVQNEAIDSAYLEAALRIKVSSDNTIFLNGTLKCNVFKEGKLITRFDHYRSVGFAISENLLMLPNMNGDGVCIYDIKSSNLTTSTPVSEIPLSSVPRYMEFTSDKDGNWYMLSDTGIYRLAKNGNAWEMAVDGSLASMSDPTMEGWDIITGDKNDFYVLYACSGTAKYSVKHYVFDKNISAAPTNTLDITSLVESNTIRKAITKYSAVNPDVKVNYKVLTNEDSNLTTSDYLKVINTELLAGKGADIYVLDNMPVDSYIEKGVFEDLSDLINPFIKDGTLTGNKIECFMQDGKLFYAPLRFAAAMAYGKKEAVKAADTMKTLADYAEKEAKIPVLCDNLYTYSELVPFLYRQYLDSSNLISEDKSYNKDELTQFLEQLKRISDQTKVVETHTTAPDYDWNSPEAVNLMKANMHCMNFSELVLIDLNSMQDLYQPIGIAEGYQEDWAIINKDTFIPKSLIGINKNSAKKEIAKAFINLCYSEEIQKLNLEDGFPVNSKALKSIAAEKDEYVESVPYYQHPYEIKQPDENTRNGIVEKCNSLVKPVNINQQVLEIFMEEVTPYLKGEAELQDTVDKIIENTKFYYSEQK